MHKPLLEIIDLIYGYMGNELTRPMTLTLRPGESCAVMGGSGVGKSSFLRVLLAARNSSLRHAHEANLWWKGDVRCLHQMSVGYIPQESSLASWLNVRENLRLPFHRKHEQTFHSEKWLTYLQRLLRLERYLDHDPSHLSFGTAKRVALARGLALTCDLYLLDEPFAGFDFDIRENAFEALSAVRSHQQDAAWLLVTHEPYEAARTCDRVLILAAHHHLATVDRNGRTIDEFAKQIRDVLSGTFAAKTS